MDPLLNSLFSGAAGATLVAAVNLYLSHHLAKKRDRINREGHEEIQRRAEIRQFRTAEDQIRDAEHTRDQKDRLQAVKTFYAMYSESVEADDNPADAKRKVETAIKMFRLEATTLDHTMHLQVSRLLELMGLMTSYYTIFRPEGPSKEYKVVTNMQALQEPLFDKCMLWGIHHKSHKLSALLDDEISKWKKHLHRTTDLK